jgi:hypothetical protein
MSDWLCVKCLHEFPDGPEVKRNPEYFGMALFMLIGLAGIVLGILVIVFYRQYAVKGGMTILGGLASMALGWQLKTGLKAICPNCGKPQGIPGDTKSADEIRRRGKK